MNAAPAKGSSSLISILIGILVVVTIAAISLVTLPVINKGHDQAELHVTGMMCDGCVANVKRSLEKLPGVKDVKVVFPYVDPNKKPLSDDEKFDARGRPIEEPKVGQVILSYDSTNLKEKDFRDALEKAGDYPVEFVKK